MFPFFKRRSADEDPQRAVDENQNRNAQLRADMLWQQGGKYLARKRLDRAVETMRQAYELEPSRLEGRLNLGAALYLTGHSEEAITHFKYVLAFDPQNTMALLNMAACYDGIGDLEQSIATLEKLVEERPQWKDAHYNLAVAYYKRGLYDQAADALRAELKINPEHDLARTLLNKIHLMLPQSRQKEKGKG